MGIGDIYSLTFKALLMQKMVFENRKKYVGGTEWAPRKNVEMSAAFETRIFGTYLCTYTKIEIWHVKFFATLNLIMKSNMNKKPYI